MKFAIRQLLKSPGFTIVALLTLALGIGVNTTAFSVLNRLLLQKLPFTDPSRMVQIWGTTTQFQEMPQSPGDYYFEKEHNTVFENVTAYYPNNMASLSEPGQSALRCTCMPVTSEFFPLIGIHPMLGRVFTPADEDRHEDLAVLSDNYWISHFQSDPKILGRTLTLNNKLVTIVGVMPALLNDPMIFGTRIDFWTLDNTSVNRNLHDNGWYNVAARLKSGATLAQAQAEMTALAKTLAHDFPKSNAERGLRVVKYPSDTMGDTGANLVWLIMGLSAGVLLIACVNLANLQLVRTTGRGQEIAVRLALGSSRWQLISMLLTESILLSLVGGALGLIIAKWSNLYLAKFLEIDMPLDFRVISFAFLTAAITGAFFGAIPAWMASRADTNSALKQGGRGGTADRSRHRFRQTLIVAELAMALVLLTGAGYFVRGIQRLSDRQLGWSPDHVLVGYFALDHDRYGEEGDPRSLTFSQHLQAELRALPGVDEAVFSRNSPVWGFMSEGFMVGGQPVPTPGHEPFAEEERITPGFFKAYGIHLLQGRNFTDADRAGSPDVAIISNSLAKEYWPNESPIGKRISPMDPSNPKWAEVVGVVNDITAAGDLLPRPKRFEIYEPWAQKSNRFMTFTLHTSQDPLTLQDAVRKTLGRIESSAAITQMDSASGMMAGELSGFSLVRRLLLQIAVLGLLLAAVGIYGVIANLASERVREVGIRIALGAQAKDVIKLFLRSGIILSLLGGAIGLGCAFGLMHILQKTMAVVPGNDPWIVIGVGALLIFVAIFACWLPAFRATKVNPIVALRPD